MSISKHGLGAVDGILQADQMLNLNLGTLAKAEKILQSLFRDMYAPFAEKNLIVLRLVSTLSIIIGALDDFILDMELF